MNILQEKKSHISASKILEKPCSEVHVEGREQEADIKIFCWTFSTNKSDYMGRIISCTWRLKADNLIYKK